MKKMIMFLSVVICSAIVQAATFNWGATSFMYKGMSMGDETQTFKFAVIDLGTNPDTSAISFSGGVLSGAKQVSTGSFTGLYGPGEQNLTGNAGNYYSAVIYHEASGFWGIGDAVLATENPTDATGNTLNPLAFDKTGVSDPWGWGMPGIMADTPSTPVPEPTAMALLLLGAAAFGMRRKIQ